MWSDTGQKLKIAQRIVQRLVIKQRNVKLDYTIIVERKIQAELFV